MSFFHEIYKKSLAENDKNIRFWEEYIKNLHALDFSVFSDKLTVPTLVPLGSRIFFRGEIKHTNEVTIALGADYFTKCSLKQAEILKQHRIKGAQTKLNEFKKEREYLENQVSFTNRNIYDNEGQEIVEVFTEEEDNAWRQQHRERVREYKQKKPDEVTKVDVTDEELWNRLEELELQEELENELENMDTEVKDSIQHAEYKTDDQEVRLDTIEDNNVVIHMPTPVQTSKLDLLQQVLNKQNELEQKLSDIKSREKTQSKSEQDLISRLDELDQLDDLEDEMNRIDDILQDEAAEESTEEESEVETSSLQQNNIKRRVSFADEDDSETLELTFEHSDNAPNADAYDPGKGIQKPSDIYQAYSNLFSETTSILKKPNYEVSLSKPINEKKKMVRIQTPNEQTVNVQNKSKEIVVKDILEKDDGNDTKLETDARPVSLFKKRRQQRNKIE